MCSMTKYLMVGFFLFLSEAEACPLDMKFECTICEKQFPRKDQLRRHEFQHKDISEYPYECEVCKKKFIEITRLRYHVQKHHQETPHVRYPGESRQRKVNNEKQVQQNKYTYLELLFYSYYFTLVNSLLNRTTKSTDKATNHNLRSDNLFNIVKCLY